MENVLTHVKLSILSQSFNLTQEVDCFLWHRLVSIWECYKPSWQIILPVYCICSARMTQIHQHPDCFMVVVKVWKDKDCDWQWIQLWKWFAGSQVFFNICSQINSISLFPQAIFYNIFNSKIRKYVSVSFWHCHREFIDTVQVVCLSFDAMLILLSLEVTLELFRIFAEFDLANIFALIALNHISIIYEYW